MIQVYAKAFVGALIAGLGSIATGLGDGTLTGQEYVYAAIAALVAFGGVAFVPNKPVAK